MTSVLTGVRPRSSPDIGTKACPMGNHCLIRVWRKPLEDSSQTMQRKLRCWLTWVPHKWMRVSTRWYQPKLPRECKHCSLCPVCHEMLTISIYLHIIPNTLLYMICGHLICIYCLEFLLIELSLPATLETLKACRVAYVQQFAKRIMVIPICLRYISRPRSYS